MSHNESDPETNSQSEEASRSRQTREYDIPFTSKIAFGVGHFFNDLSASMWFTYMMVYMQKVIKFRSSRAGLLMLVGQATDAVSTPLVGILSDSDVLSGCFHRIGNRISWHMIGTLCVALSFPFIFNKCFICHEESSEWIKFAWFVVPIVFFQFGWASVQISHLALIPELTNIPSSRATLNSIRYAFSVIANLTVFFVLAWFLSESTGHRSIGPWDQEHFEIAALLCVGLGTLTSIVFYAFTKEPKNVRRERRSSSFSSNASNFVRMHWTSWFGYIQFYQIALLYMLCRLYVNISQVYFPFYITLTQNFDKKYVAIFPMISYISSFLVSLVKSHPFVSKHVPKTGLLCMGLITGMSACVSMLFELQDWRMYLVAMAIGITQAVLLITSLSITADFINKNTVEEVSCKFSGCLQESGAFVFGAMSFLDKLSNGLAYQIIELFNPTCDALKPHEACKVFFRKIMVFVPGSCLLFSFVILITLMPQNIGDRSRQPIQDNDEQPILEEEDE